VLFMGSPSSFSLRRIINPLPPKSINDPRRGFIRMIRDESPPEKEIGHGHNGLPKFLVKGMSSGPLASFARIISC
jgi:hypothetical protein